MTTPQIISTVTSTISIVIAFAAFITSRRVQHANYNLQLQLAQRPGRLQQVKVLYPNRHERMGYGFKVINGPDEVKVSRAILYMTYRIYRRSAIRWIDEKFEFLIRPHELKILGISGKEFGFRLAPYDEEEWRFPYDLPGLHYETGDGNRQQEIQFRFAVTASEDTKSSDSLTFGASPVMLFAERARHTAHVSLEKVLLGVLAQDAVRGILSSSPSAQVPSDLKKLVLPFDVPVELRNWLVDAWKQAGSFSDESIEKRARTLLKLRPPHPDPDLLATYIRAAPQDQPPSTRA